MKVTNIKVTSNNFAKLLKTNKNLQKCCKYLPAGIKATDVLRVGDQTLVDFKLTNTTSDFANAIRIALIEESEVQALGIKTWETDDDFVVFDYLAKRIEAIPIQQEKDYKKKKITLNVLNETREMLTVLSGDIKIDGKENNSRYFENTMQIIRLCPGRSIKMTLEVETGDGRMDSNRFSNVANIRYRPGNKPLNEATGDGKSSLDVNPTSFDIGFTNYRNASVKNIISRTHQTLASRLKMYHDLLSLPKVTGKKITYSSKLLEVETLGDIYVVTFFGEFRTIPNLIARYCYEIQPTIKFVTASIKHRSTELGYIKINHAEPLKLMQGAIKKVLKDLDTFKNAFK